MIKHIVMWKIKDFAEGKSKIENIKFIKEKLEGLQSHIPEIKYIEVGMNINESDMGYDAVLYSEFSTLEDLNIYQNHPKHKEISAYVAKIRTDRAVGDYII